MAYSAPAPGIALAFILLFGWRSVIISGTVLTVVNKCSYTVWPAALSGNAGTLVGGGGGGGFVLPPGQSVPLRASAGWSGRLWGRTDCIFDATGKGSCATGDCANVLNCDHASGAPPASLVEVTLGDKDFYDVSLVDGFNVPLTISALGGSGDCRTGGCVSDLRNSCPAELSIISSRSNGNGERKVIACKSACLAFGTAEYCCTGEHANPQTCSPTKYSRLFKSACPTAYSYAYDDKTSLITCSNADYTITFCPPNAT